MIPGYTAIDLIRTMNQELVERHQQAARHREVTAVRRERASGGSLRDLILRGHR